jgi:hypothetical protein
MNKYTRPATWEDVIKVKSNSMRPKDIADFEIIKQLIDALPEENFNQEKK